MYGQVYLITNKINGKRYVGQTTKELTTRLHQHFVVRRKSAIHSALRKYGESNFSIETLVRSETQEQLNSDEDFYILVCQTMSPKGYNLKRGGGCGEMVEEIKAARRGKNNHFYGKKHTPAALAKMRGRKFSQSHIDKMRQITKERWQNPEYRHKQISRPYNVTWMNGPDNHRFRHEVSTEEIVSLYLAGRTIADIARKVDATRSCVRKRLKRTGVYRGKSVHDPSA